jgi:hypothetical protein
VCGSTELADSISSDDRRRPFACRSPGGPGKRRGRHRCRERRPVVPSRIRVQASTSCPSSVRVRPPAALRDRGEAPSPAAPRTRHRSSRPSGCRENPRYVARTPAGEAAAPVMFWFSVWGSRWIPTSRFLVRVPRRRAPWPATGPATARARTLRSGWPRSQARTMAGVRPIRLLNRVLRAVVDAGH